MTASHGQPTYEAHMLSFVRLNQTYASEEFSPINHQLAFPTAEPNLQQRTDETKATKLQIQALNNWQREFDIRLQKIIDDQKKLHSSNALVYQNFADSVSSVYGKLKRKEINFGNANQALMTAQTTLVFEPENTPKSAPKTPTVISPSTTQPLQPKLPPMPIAELAKKATPTNSANASSNTVCDQKLVELEALRLEEENWYGVTTSLNQVIKQSSDREIAEQAQGVQSRERQIKIMELTSFRTKNCKH
jgi:hypothetical protein